MVFTKDSLSILKNVKNQILNDYCSIEQETEGAIGITLHVNYI